MIDFKTLESYVEENKMTQKEYDLVIKHINNKSNILVGSKNNGGKTFLLHAIAEKMIDNFSSDNFIVLDNCALEHNFNQENILTAPDWNLINNRKISNQLRFIVDEFSYGTALNFKMWMQQIKFPRIPLSFIGTIYADSIKDMLFRFKSIGEEFTKNLYLYRGFTQEFYKKYSEDEYLLIHLKKTPQGILIDDVKECKKGLLDELEKAF